MHLGFTGKLKDRPDQLPCDDNVRWVTEPARNRKKPKLKVIDHYPKLATHPWSAFQHEPIHKG